MRNCRECVFAVIRKTKLRDDPTLVDRIWCTYKKMIREGWEAEYCERFIPRNEEIKTKSRREANCLECEHLVLVPFSTNMGQVMVPYCKLTGEMVSVREGIFCPKFRKKREQVSEVVETTT